MLGMLLGEQLLDPIPCYSTLSDLPAYLAKHTLFQGGPVPLERRAVTHPAVLGMHSRKLFREVCLRPEQRKIPKFHRPLSQPIEIHGSNWFRFDWILIPGIVNEILENVHSTRTPSWHHRCDLKPDFGNFCREFRRRKYSGLREALVDDVIE